MIKFFYFPFAIEIYTRIKNLHLALFLVLICVGKVNAQTYTSFRVQAPGISNPTGCAICGGNNFYIATININGPTPLNYTGFGVNPSDNTHVQLDLTGNATYNTATVTAGLSSTFTLTRGIDNSYGSYFQVYIDWNNDGSFGTSGTELLGISSTISPGSAGPYTFNYTIPAGTTPGAYRMRVISMWTNLSGPLPNGASSAQGEAIDFRITVLSGCTVPTAGAAWGSPSNTGSTQTDISFTRGNGDGGVIVLARDNASVNAVPSSGTTYSAGTNFTGSSVPFADVANGQSQIGSGNYVVYTGTGSNPGALITTTITNLTFNHTFYFSVFEYNAASTCYVLTGTTGNVLITTPCTGAPTAGTATAVLASFCPNGSTTINLTGYTTNVSGIAFKWQSSPDGSAWSDISGATSTSYTTPSLVNVTGSNKLYYYHCLVICQSSGQNTPSNTVTVTVLPTPVIKVNGINPYSASICNSGSPNSVSLTASNTSSGTTTYIWSPGSGLNTNVGATVSASPATPITYTVTGNSGGCQATATAIIGVNPTVLTFNPAAPSVASGGGVSITATSTSTNGGVTYSWAPGTYLNTTTGATVNSTPNANITYTVTATDASGCSRTGTIAVVVKSGSAGQVSCGYSFSTGTGYTSITGTTIGRAGNTNYLLDPPTGTPFLFDYNGITYTKFGVNGNGFIWPFTFGSVPATTTTPLSSTAAVDGMISVFGGPITGASVGYLLQGTSPNRTLTIQWGTAAMPDTSGGKPIQCQIILYEHNPGGANSDKIQLAYAGQPASPGMTGNYQIGLRGVTNTDFNNRMKAAGSNMNQGATLAGSLNTSTVSFTGSDIISGSVLWTFTPTIPTPSISPGGQQNICTSGSGGSGVTLTAVTTLSSPTYQWVNFTSGGDIPGATASTYLADASTAGNYFYAVKVFNGTCYRTSSATPVVASVCCSSISGITPASGSVCPGATTSLTANGVTGPNYVLTWWTGSGATGAQLGSANQNPLTNVGPGTYYAYVTADCESSAEASVSIGTFTNVTLSSVTALANPICSSTTTNLAANGVGGSNAVVTWYSGSGGTGSSYGTGSSLLNRGPGTYYARVTGICGSPVEDSVVLAAKVNAAVTAAIPASSTVCAGGTTSITAVGVAGTGASLHWWGGSGGTGADYGTTNPLTGVGAGTYYALVTADCGTIAQVSATITSVSCNDQFTVKLFLQGYYLGGNAMSPLLHMIDRANHPDNDVDTVTIELYDPAPPNDLHDFFRGVVTSDGVVSCSFPNTPLGGSYYIAVRHRNSITTFSTNPVIIDNGGLYDFTGSADQAYGAMANIGGVYCIYSGDINRDGAISNSDKTIMEGVLPTFKVGVYNVNDLTGDGFVDEDDYRLLIDNIPLGISSLHL